MDGIGSRPTDDRVTVRLVATAGSHEGRGHLARAIALAAALRRTMPQATIVLTLLRGQPSGRQQARLASLDVAVVDGLPAEVPARHRRTVMVVDLPEPNEVGALPWPAPNGPPATVIFDDRERYHGRADVIVQPSRPAWSGGADAGRILAGYRYAPIDDEYRTADRPRIASRRRPTVFVCFGGSDPDDVTGRLAPAVSADDRWTTEVIVGAGYRGAPDAPGYAPVRDPTDFVDRLARCDIALTGAGTIKFEAAFLGRPTLIVGAADDQLAVGPLFASTGAARWLGDGRELQPAMVTAQIADLAADLDARRALASCGRATIDGRGADRIAQVVNELAGSGRGRARRSP